MCPHLSEAGTQPYDSNPPDPKRRRFIEFLLGAGMVASAISFLYPVLRPPKVVNLGKRYGCSRDRRRTFAELRQDFSFRKQARHPHSDASG